MKAAQSKNDQPNVALNQRRTKWRNCWLIRKTNHKYFDSCSAPSRGTKQDIAEKDVLKQEKDVLKQDKDVLKQEKNVLKQEKEILKQEIIP